MNPEDITKEYIRESRLLLNAIQGQDSLPSLKDLCDAFLVDALKAEDALYQCFVREFKAQVETQKQSIPLLCYLFQSIKWSSDFIDEIKDTLNKMKRVLGIVVTTSLIDQEQADNPVVRCADGNNYTFFVVQEDIPSIKKERLEKVYEKMREALPEYLRDAWRPDFSFRALQQVTKQADELGIPHDSYDLQVDFKSTLRSRKNA